MAMMNTDVAFSGDRLSKEINQEISKENKRPNRYTSAQKYKNKQYSMQNAVKIQEAISNTLKNHLPDAHAKLELEPLKNIHLYGYFGGGPIIYVYIFHQLEFSFLSFLA